ncbi:MAG TPA: putative lipid II flippase FtsW [Propionibacteriaceae bacterium]|nr:putative lipid II flippase FtsW [Propionibacteriaceae bacterium]
MATVTPSRPGSRGRAGSSTISGSGPTGSGSGFLAALQSVLDRPLASYHLVLGSAALLVALGVMMVLSASSVNAYINYDDSYYFVKRQAVFLTVGLVGAGVILKLSHPTLRVLSWLGLALAAVMLILTYTPLGVTVGGNRNWLYLGSSLFLVQPAEFAKLAMIVWGADLLARKQKLLDRPLHLLIPYLPVCGLLVLLVVFQGDAGTAVVMAGIVAGVLWIVGAPMRVFASFTALGIAGIVGLFVTSPNRMRRLAAFLDPSADLNGANDQANAGMYAIVAGGWWGVGLGASRQKWGSLPEAHTDFIFAVIGEEFGLFGSLIVLALFLVLGYAGFRVAMRSDEAFARYAAAGVTVWFVLQSLINLAVVLRMLPIAGVPLPLVSYGGSALIANLLAVGVLLSCARREPAARKLLAKKTRTAKPRMTAVVGSRRSGG